MGGRARAGSSPARNDAETLGWECRAMGDILDGYALASAGRRGPLAAAYDEVVDAGGVLRPHYEEGAGALSAMSAGDVSARAERLAHAFRHQGVTFDLDGEERPFPLDVVPRLLTAREWDVV